MFSSQEENFVSTSKSLLENRNWTFPVAQFLTWKLEFFSYILSAIVSGNSVLLLSQPRSLEI